MKSIPLSALNETMSPEELAAAKEKAAAMLLDIRLAELQETARLSQVEITIATGISQSPSTNLDKSGKD